MVTERKNVMIIKYNGEEIETKHWTEVSDEMFIQLKKDYYEKPLLSEVKKEMVSISKGGGEKYKYYELFCKRPNGENKIISFKMEYRGRV